MAHWVRWPFVAASILSSLACASSPLASYIKANHFTPFQIPRDKDGEGSVIAYNAGQEVIVVSPDPPSGRCLTAEHVPHGSENVFMTTTSYTLKTDWSLDFDLGKVLGQNANVKGALSDNRVKTVQIELLQPFVRRITQIDVEKYVKELAPDDPCRAAILGRKNYTLHTVLGANGLRYSFVGKNEAKIKLDAELLKQMNIHPGLTSSYDGKDALDVNQIVLIGYRAWQGLELPGLVASSMRLQEIPAEELRKARAASAGR